MKNRHLSAQEKLDRVKWNVYGLVILFLVAIELYYLFRGVPFLDNIVDLMLGAVGAGILIEFAFWHTKRLQIQVDEELQNSRRHFRQMVSLHVATTALVMTRDLHELLERVLEATMNAIQSADNGSIYLVDPETNQLKLEALRGEGIFDVANSDELDGYTVAYEQGYADKAIKTKEAILVPDIHFELERPRSHENESKFQVRSAILAPLLLEDRGVGVLVLHSYSLNAFSEMDLTSLITFATTAAASIYNAQLYSEAHYLATTDVLTGLNNRRNFFELARNELGRAQRYERSLSLLMIDLDHFKQVNDQYGHTVGDQVLQAVAQRCKDIIRQQDVIGRYGGEEFAVILPETDSQAAYLTANRIRAHIADTPFRATNGDAISLTVSIGIASLDQDIQDLTLFLNTADTALYKAKGSGKNCIVVA